MGQQLCLDLKFDRCWHRWATFCEADAGRKMDVEECKPTRRAGPHLQTGLLQDKAVTYYHTPEALDLHVSTGQMRKREIWKLDSRSEMSTTDRKTQKKWRLLVVLPGHSAGRKGPRIGSGKEMVTSCSLVSCCSSDFTPALRLTALLLLYISLCFMAQDRTGLHLFPPKKVVSKSEPH